MLLRMLAGLSGPHFNLSPGDEREFDDAEAARLIAAGFAEQMAAPAASKRKGKADVVSGESDGSGDGGAVSD